MILWVNGAFGAGKKTVCDLLIDRIPDSVLFDSERVGYSLSPLLESARPVQNFRGWLARETELIDSTTRTPAELAEAIAP